MRVYSWNVLYANKQLPEVKDFIEHLDFDVLCLQEVPVDLLQWLKEFSKELACSTDVEEKEGTHTYLVILSRHPILKSETYQVPIPNSPFRAQVTTWIVRRFTQWRPMANKEALFADISYQGQTVRVYCVHLTICGPGFRVKEFKKTLERRDTSKPEIIAGDLNVIEHPIIKIYSWLLGSPLSEGMPWFPERALFQKTLADQNLQNPLRGHITHPFSISQLDHILLSNGLTATKAWVEMDSHGSDHQPVGVEVEYTTSESDS